MKLSQMVEGGGLKGLEPSNFESRGAPKTMTIDNRNTLINKRVIHPNKAVNNATLHHSWGRSMYDTTLKSLA